MPPPTLGFAATEGVGVVDTESNGRRERRRAGQEVRSKVPRDSLGVWEPPADRRDPVQILIDQGDSRVQDLVPVRYARMLSSEFAFYRGAAAVMASDLSYSPNTHLTVQLAGDAHLCQLRRLRVPGSNLRVRRQ